MRPERARTRVRRDEHRRTEPGTGPERERGGTRPGSGQAGPCSNGGRARCPHERMAPVCRPAVPAPRRPGPGGRTPVRRRRRRYRGRTGTA